MNDVIALDRKRRVKALQDWIAKCRHDLGEQHRYPEIDFEAEMWPIRSKYRTTMEDINFGSLSAAFSDRDGTYLQAFRCAAAELAIANKQKGISHEFSAWQLLARCSSSSLLDLHRSDLQSLEKSVVEECKSSPQSAARIKSYLQCLSKFVGRLSRLRVIEPAPWSIGHETRKTLQAFAANHNRRFKGQKALILDRQIEALSDALNALVRADSRLTPYDRAAIAVMGVMMCAPSRINEPLCMSIDDVFTLQDYIQSTASQASNNLASVHKLLLQKGSKGATWSAKPALNFMIGLLNFCVQTLKTGGERSRMLVEWYEKHPEKLYLPPTLEHYRDQMIDRAALWQIINLTERPPIHVEVSSGDSVWGDIRDECQVHVVSNPRARSSDGSKNPCPTVQAVKWGDVERILLRRVHEALRAVRRVTNKTHYEGRISRMLMLFDSDVTPYLPTAIKYQGLHRRLGRTQIPQDGTNSEKRGKFLTVFQKLDLIMTVDGRVEHAWIGTHDPRRWLTTQAMQAKERLSDVLVNKWANRISIDQLKHYDLRSAEQKADQASMPVPDELADISAGLEKIAGVEAEYGLKTEIVIAHDAGVSVTSMDLVASAVETRPTARTSNQLIVIYPSRFGVCLHQHHETPCRSYSSCLPCSEGAVVKGHLPTNEEIKKRDALLTRSIVAQLDLLVTAHNRGIADFPSGLENHMLVLVHKGLTVEQMADDLIQSFHEIKDRIKSPCLRTKLEDAFVARGMVQRLDDPAVPAGALMRYHNPSRHASPGHERVLDSLGGRAAIETQLKEFHREHPKFAPTTLGLMDERELLEQEGDDEDDTE